MTFKPEFLTSIGIDPASVPKRVTAAFTNANEHLLEIKSGDNSATVEVRRGAPDPKEEVARVLVSFGAQHLRR